MERKAAIYKTAAFVFLGAAAIGKFGFKVDDVVWVGGVILSAVIWCTGEIIASVEGR